MRSKKLPGSDPVFDRFLCRAHYGRSVLHLTIAEPFASTALCGQRVFGHSTEPSANFDLTYTVCARCYQLAQPNPKEG